MYKNSLIILLLLALSSCNQSKPTPSPKVEGDVKVDVIHRRIEPTTRTEESSTITPSATPIATHEEFIPEHIRRSRIEVVKHY